MVSEQDRIDEEQHTDDDERALAPHNVVDKVAFGRRLRALRIINGYDRMEDFASVLRSRFGVDVSSRTVYAIERGEQMPHLDLVLASLCMLDAASDYFLPAFRKDCVEMLQERWSR